MSAAEQLVPQDRKPGRGHGSHKRQPVEPIRGATRSKRTIRTVATSSDAWSVSSVDEEADAASGDAADTSVAWGVIDGNLGEEDIEDEADSKSDAEPVGFVYV